jgi:hypothetical protein
VNSVPLGRLNQLVPVADALLSAASLTATTTRKFLRDRRKSHRYTALRPGPDTPLWNELATAVAKSFRRRGEKARLARLLGISRQRLHVLIVSRDACPDAERTLQLLAWLQARQRGLDPA